MYSWLVMRYPSAPRESISSPCHSLPLSSTPNVTFNKQHGGCFQRNKGRLPYPCTWPILPYFNGLDVVHLFLFLCVFSFCYFMFFACLYFLCEVVRILVSVISLQTPYASKLKVGVQHLNVQTFNSSNVFFFS